MRMSTILLLNLLNTSLLLFCERGHAAARDYCRLSRAAAVWTCR